MIAQGAFEVNDDEEGGLEGAAEKVVDALRRELDLRRSGVKPEDPDELPWD